MDKSIINMSEISRIAMPLLQYARFLCYDFQYKNNSLYIFLMTIYFIPNCIET